MLFNSQISNLKLVVLALVFCSLVVNMACKNSDVDTALGIASSNSAQLARRAAAVYGAEDPRTKRVEDWSGKLGRLKSDFANATTPEEQVKLLPTLNASIDFFDTDILPLLKLTPDQSFIAMAIEDALRLVANHFVKTAGQVKASVPESMASAAVSDSAVNAEAETAKLQTYLKSRLRAREAKTGRFVSIEYAREHPDTTVIERVKQ